MYVRDLHLHGKWRTLPHSLAWELRAQDCRLPLGWEWWPVLWLAQALLLLG
jgi:hypothetical protein